MNGKTGLRIVSALVLIAAIAGIAFFAFQAGVAQGSPITIEAPSGETAPVPYPYYGTDMGCPSIVRIRIWIRLRLLRSCCSLFFLLFMSLPLPLLGSTLGTGVIMAHGGRHWGEGGVPPMFEEWHKRAHGEAA